MFELLFNISTCHRSSITLLLFCAVVSYILHLCINLTNFYLLKKKGNLRSIFLCQNLHFLNLNLPVILFLSRIPLLLSVWTIDVAVLCIFFHYLSFFCSSVICFFLFIYSCTWVSENWRYCSVTSSDSVTPRRFSTTPTTHCCLGCGPTAPPTCQGTGTHPATTHSFAAHPDRWPKARQQLYSQSTLAIEICRATHSTGVHNRCFPSFLHGHLVCLTVFH